MIKCEIIQSDISDEQQHIHMAYGLVFYDSSREITRIDDLFLDRCRAEKLRKKINENDICFAHIMDVIEDNLI